MPPRSAVLERDALESVNPATLEPLGRVPVTPPGGVREAVERARKAQPDWAGLDFEERAFFLRRFMRLLLERQDEVVQLVVRENGKTTGEAYAAEIYPVCDTIRYFSRHGERLLEPEILGTGLMGWYLRRRAELHYRPVGVVGIIAPWNFPFFLAGAQSAMALLAGNTVVLKPSELTPLVGKKLEELFKAAELPEGVFNLVTGAGETGAALVSSPLDKILFTGSTGVGAKIMEAAGRNLTPLVLELGGKDPMIVRQDADLDRATSGLVWGSFVYSGQVCASIKRIYVHDSVYPKFVEQFVGNARMLRQGDPSNPETEIGAIISRRQLEMIDGQVKKALSQGAKLLLGGEPNRDLKGHFYKPTIFEVPDHSIDIAKEETFGPVVCLFRVPTDERAIELANDSPYGLTAGVWTRDIERGHDIATRLAAGTVYVNDCAYTGGIPYTPWGGIKKSGFGRTLGRLGLLELVHPVHVNINPRPGKPSPWWFPHGTRFVDFVKDSLELLFGRRMTRAWFKALFRIRRNMIR